MVDGHAAIPQRRTGLVSGPTLLGLGLLVVALIAFGWVTSLPVMVLPLLVRIKASKVLDDPAREAIFDAIRDNPGITYKEICELSHMSRSAVVHHVSVIERAGLLKVERIGRCRHHFVNSLRIDARARRAMAALRSRLSRKAFDYVRGHPGALQQEVASRLEVHPNQARRILSRLVDAGLLACEYDGRVKRFHVVGSITIDGVLTTHADN